jgi:anti-sigma regulatory factor (Ser/Thr protein kinase)
MREIALHLLDIAENSIAAEAKRITLTVTEDTEADRLTVCVEDDGKGMDAVTAEQAVDPFATSRTTRKVGLGIPLLKEAAEACDGGLRLVSAPGKGTRLTAEFQRSHIDRMPLGNLAGTVYTLVVAYPNVHWILNYTVDDHKFYFDSEPILKALGDETLIAEPEVLRFIRNLLEMGIAEMSRMAKPQRILEAL